MHRRNQALGWWACAALALTCVASNGGAQDVSPEARRVPSPNELAGTWVGTLHHEGEARTVAFHLETTQDGQLAVTMSTPALHLWEFPMGPAALESGGIRIAGIFPLSYDAAAGTLTGTIPAALVPVYKLPVTFRRGPLASPERPEPTAPIVKPVWVFEAGSPVWADVAFAYGVVYVGDDDGHLHALDARTGRPRWTFRAGGAIRARPTLWGADLFVQADDGCLYRISARDGREVWRVRVNEKPIERIPIADARSRFDSFASAATFAQGRLYIGTHTGRVLALDPARGIRVWEFAAGDSVVSTPVVDSGHVYFGSFDGNIYAVDAASGALLWKHDTGAPVVSMPGIHEGNVIVGSRSYDLLALNGRTGAPVWNRYIWFSWVESPVTIWDHTVYVGSSDAAKLFAFDARTGGLKWELDAWGWSWGQPAVTDKRVFIGTGGDGQYMIKHRGGALAVDRATGRMVWRFPVGTPADGSPYGFPASPALGDGHVFIGATDGRVYAFAQ